MNGLIKLQQINVYKIMEDILNNVQLLTAFFKHPTKPKIVLFSMKFWKYYTNISELVYHDLHEWI